MTLGSGRRRGAADHPPAAAAGPREQPAKGETAIWRPRPGSRLDRTRRGRVEIALWACALVAVAIGFEVVYGQLPLYSGSQHGFVPYGLAQAGVGLLEVDWQAGTVDPAPIASLLVAAAARSEAEWLLLLLHAILIGVYGLALFALGSTVLGLRGRVPQLVFLASLLFVHSWLAVEIRPWAAGDLRSLLTEGLAGQRAPGPVFEPSLFGVLLVVSLLLYLRGRLTPAVAFAGAAAIFDPAYLLGALVLAGIYLADTYANSGARTAVIRGAAVAVALLAPVAVHGLFAFPAAPAGIHEAAQDALVDFRLRDQARPDVWFGADDAIRLGIVVAGIALAWRSVLFPVLALTVAVSGLLTALALVTGSETLALLFPWRTSVFLVPVSAAIVLAAATWALFALGRAGERVASRFSDGTARLRTGARTGVAVLAGMTIAASLVVGSERIERLEGEPSPGPVGRLLADRRLPGELYLVPPRAFELRVDGGVPVYVDYEAHPFEDRELLEWRRRLRAAARVYPGPRVRCRALAALARRERITHFVASPPARARCRFLGKELRAGRSTVFTIDPGAVRRPARAGSP